MPWGKTRCTETDGWRGRIASKLALGGVTGVAVGSILGTLNNAPLLRFTAASTASFVLLMGCFSVLQETSRLVRCEDSPANGAVGGAAAGALLFKAHGRPAAMGMLVCSVLGGSAHWAAEEAEVEGRVRRVLVSMNLLDPAAAARLDEAEAQRLLRRRQRRGVAEGEEEGGGMFGVWGLLRPYSPVRRMSEEEWEQYQALQDETHRQRIESTLAGGLPVMVERKRQQAEGKQRDGGGGQG